MARTEALLRLFFPFLILVLGLSVGLMVPDFFEFIRVMGRNIPQTDLSYDYTVALITAIFIGFSIPFWPISRSDQKVLVYLWIARSLITLGFMLYYEYNYGLDAYQYFDDARSGTFQWDILSALEGTSNVTAFVWFISELLPYKISYHALKVIFSLIGLIATFIVYRAGVLYIEREDRRLLYILGLFPSLLFWSSILGKDPLNMLGISLYFYGVIAFFRRKKFGYFLLIAIGTFIAMLVRIWSALILLAPLFSVGIRNMHGFVKKVLAAIIFLAGLYYAMQSFADRFQVETTAQLIASTQAISHSWARGGSAQALPEFKSVGQMINFAPVGMFTALFRPLPGEVMNFFGLLAGIENFVILLLAILSFTRTGLKFMNEPILFWTVSLVFFWAFIYGFVSYQNLGAAVRFKLQILPIMICLVLYLSNREKYKIVWHSRVS